MTQWFYRIDDQEAGPVDTSELKRLFACGELSLSDKFRGNGSAKWVPMKEIAKLHEPAPSLGLLPQEILYAKGSPAMVPMKELPKLDEQARSPGLYPPEILYAKGSPKSDKTLHQSSTPLAGQSPPIAMNTTELQLYFIDTLSRHLEDMSSRMPELKRDLDSFGYYVSLDLIQVAARISARNKLTANGAFELSGKYLALTIQYVRKLHPALFLESQSPDNCGKITIERGNLVLVYKLLAPYDKHFSTTRGREYLDMLSSFAVWLASTATLPASYPATALEEINADISAAIYSAPSTPPTATGIPARSTKKARPKISAEVQTTPATPNRPELNHLLAELDGLVGLVPVKEEIRNLVNFLKVQRLRESKGMPVSPISRHLVLCGNPGTGKTTIARLISQIYVAIGLLTQGHVVETDRAGMVAGYVGQTALKVKELVQSARGGVLFIDEAYSLIGAKDDFGHEAIATLLKEMEDHRDDLVVVAAGYPDRMNNFIESNPGLRSRFSKSILFPDYSPEQLMQIFEMFCTSSQYRLSDAATLRLTVLFMRLHAERNESFGNARVARNIFERVITQQANRIAPMQNVTSEILETLEESDVHEAVDVLSDGGKSNIV